MQETFAQDITVSDEVQHGLIPEQIREYFNDEKKEELLSKVKEKVDHWKGLDQVKSEKELLQTHVNVILKELNNPMNQSMIDEALKSQELKLEIQVGNRSALQTVFDNVDAKIKEIKSRSEEDVERRLFLQELREMAVEALKQKWKVEVAEERYFAPQPSVVELEGLREPPKPFDANKTRRLHSLHSLENYVIDKAAAYMLRTADVQPLGLLEKIDEILKEEIETIEQAQQILSPQPVENEQAETIGEDLSELQRQLNESVEKLEKDLSLEATQQELLALFEANNPDVLKIKWQEFNQKSSSQLKLIEPLLAQFEQYLNEKPESQLTHSYARLKEIEHTIKKMHEDAKRSYITKREIFNLVGNATSLRSLENTLSQSKEFLTQMQEEYQQAGREFPDISSLVSAIAQAVDTYGPDWEQKYGKFELSAYPLFIAEKLQMLIKHELENWENYQELRRSEENRREMEFFKLLMTVEKPEDFLNGMRKLGWFKPKESSEDAVAIALAADAWFDNVDLSLSEQEIEDSLPDILRQPQIKATVLGLLPKTTAYQALEAIKRGKYSNDLVNLIKALRRIGQQYYFSDEKQLSAVTLANVLKQMYEKWNVQFTAHMWVPKREIFGIPLGKRRITREELKEKFNTESLKPLFKEKNSFILDAIVSAFDHWL